MKTTDPAVPLIFRTDAESAEAAKRLAAAQDRSLSSVLRRALRAYLADVNALPARRDERAEVSR